MRHPKIKRAAALVVLLAVASLVAFARVNNDPPTDQQKEFAEQTADLLQKEVFAALLQEFGETTPENVEQGKQAVSLIFHDSNRDIRLIGVFPPLLGGNNNIPSDPFERQSLALALQGKPNMTVERVGNRWYYRRSIALSRSSTPSPVTAETSTGRRSGGMRAVIVASRPHSSSPNKSALFHTSRSRSSRSGSIPRSRSTCRTSAASASVSPWEMSLTWSRISASITSSSVARNAATSMVGRSEMKPTVSDRIAVSPCGSLIAREVGSSVANSRFSAKTPAAVMRLNRVDLPALV